MFCISFVVVTVKARLASLDPRLEQAAMDLYANERQAFRKITLPLVLRASSAPRCWRSRCRSTTSSSRTSTRGQFTTFPKFVYVSACAVSRRRRT
jgi:spermidine/putrescine transport system permease protein